MSVADKFPDSLPASPDGDMMRHKKQHTSTTAATTARRVSWCARPLPDGVPGRVRALREQLSWTQAELAVIAGLAVITVRQIETGKRSPSLTTASKLAAALGVTVDALTGPIMPTHQES